MALIMFDFSNKNGVLN